MKKYIIGITCRILTTDKGTSFRVDDRYIKQLTDRGATCILLLPTPNLEKALKCCDGFLVIGGDDFDPVMYGENNDLQLSKEINYNLDQMDTQIVQYAYNNQIPLLGICRGHQALSACYGKKLYQDIHHSGLHHEDNNHFHVVKKVQSAPLADLLPDEFVTNTFHHQATCEIPNDFIITFKAGDVIEAIEHKSLPIVGIQWHPERMNTPETKIIFDYFVKKVLNA